MTHNTEFDNLMREISTPDAILRLLEAPLPDNSSPSQSSDHSIPDFDPYAPSMLYTPYIWQFPDVPVIQGPDPDPDRIQHGLNNSFNTYWDLWYPPPGSSSTTVVEHSPTTSSSSFGPTRTPKRPRQAKIPGTDRLDWRTPHIPPPTFVCTHFPEGVAKPQRMDHHYKYCEDNPDRSIWNCPVEGCPKSFAVKWNLKRHLRSVHNISDFV